MLDKQLVAEIENEIESKPFAFWGFSIALTSLAYAIFNLSHTGLLSSLLSPPYSSIPENLISWGLFIASLLKLYGILMDNATLKRLGIVILSGIWGMLFIFSVTFSFGVGYPTTRFITTGFIVVACLRVSFKGDYS